MRRLATACVLLCLAGCAGTAARDSLGYEYREQDRINQFMDYRRQCLDRGGIVVVSARGGLRRDGLPRRADQYSCRRGSLRGLALSR